MDTNTPQIGAEAKILMTGEIEKVIKSLPKEKQEVLVAEIMRIQSFSGPIPPPEIMQGYENILKGSADRILSMAENQATHRMEIEKSVVKRSLNQKTFGLIMGSVIALVILGITVYFAVLGLVWLAGVLATTTFVAALTILILGRTPSNKDDKEAATPKKKKK